MSRSILTGLFVASAMTCQGWFGAGQVAAADADIVEKMTAGKIERIMSDLALVNVTEIDNNTYRFEYEGLKILVFNKEDTMQLYAGFSGAKISLSRINEWNKTKRFTRAYLDKDNDPVLEGDIELTGGVTEKNVKEWIKTYQVSIRAYKKHLEE